MGEVIHYDFTKVIPTDLLNKQAHANGENMSQAEAYIMRLAAELDEEDFWEFAEAVNNPDLYPILDEDLKDLADGFWACNPG